MKLILASNSPRRRELLRSLVRGLEVIPSRFAEVAAGLSARETSISFAAGKAEEVFSRFPDCAVLGADTVVSFEGRILGKPASEEEARATLALLSGREHSVYTGVCLITPAGRWEDVVETRVTFRKLKEVVIESYVNSGLPMDKAGAYGIQDGYPLVRYCEGSYTNVVGLPMERLGVMLCEAQLIQSPAEGTSAKEERSCSN